MRNLSYENEFCTQFLFHANKSHFHNNGFALRLALKLRHKGTRKWPIVMVMINWKMASRSWHPSPFVIILVINKLLHVLLWLQGCPILKGHGQLWDHADPGH